MTVELLDDPLGQGDLSCRVVSRQADAHRLVQLVEETDEILSDGGMARGQVHLGCGEHAQPEAGEAFVDCRDPGEEVQDALIDADPLRGQDRSGFAFDQPPVPEWTVGGHGVPVEFEVLVEKHRQRQGEGRPGVVAAGGPGNKRRDLAVQLHSRSQEQQFALEPAQREALLEAFQGWDVSGWSRSRGR